MKKAEGKHKRLVLFDAHAILHRAYHALPEFTNSKGEPTGALYGLASMLIKIIADLKPDYMAAAYDLPKPTFRHEAYKDYKAGRAKADDALISQMKRSREVFEALGIPLYDKEGFEADDILGTIVEQLQKKANLQIVIASGDIDTLQLVNDKRVQVYTLKKGINDTILYDEEKVKERFGFGPELLPDFKGLKGDPSDNIKGIAGIGDKTATELIVKFGSLEEIYKKLKKESKEFEKTGIKPRVIGLLEKGREDAEFSKILATIRHDVPIDFALPKTVWRKSVNLAAAAALFQKLEFRTLGERLRAALEIKPAQASLYSSKEEQKEKRKADMPIPEPEEFAETAVALWLINSTVTNPTLEDILNFGETRLPAVPAHAGQAGDFAAARAAIFTELKKRNLTRVFEEIERPLIPVVEQMNQKGVAIDAAYLLTLSKNYHQELEKREKNIWKMAGSEFNLNSPKQLGEVLFMKMGLKVARQKKTVGGALSTRESELEKLRGLHPIISSILEYREFQKLLSTYIDTIPQMVAKDGRLHARFLSAGSTTGRMASEDPNLQNIPVHTPLGRAIRNAFVAEKGNLLLGFDYSQIELRVAAILSRDPKFMAIFKAGGDVHAAVASEVFSIPLEKVDKDLRRKAKVINFGILYGMGVNSLRTALSPSSAEASAGKEGGLPFSREEAAEFLRQYFARFSVLAAYLEATKEQAREQGFTETLFGRRRYFEAINSPLPYIRAAAERQATNAPVQGTATADIIKLAMVRVDAFLKVERLEKNAALILQVHDELVYEVKENLVETLAPRIKEIMESILTPEQSRGVPIVADASVGANWGEMKNIVNRI